jgi:hypothetical protein
LTEITQSIIVSASATDLFDRADELLATLLEQDHANDGLSLSIRKTSPVALCSEEEGRRTSPGPLGLGTAFRATVRAGGLPLGVELRCTEYVSPQRVTVRSANGLPLAVTLEFQPHPDGGTVVTTRLRYEPPPGMAGVLLQTFAPPAKIEQTMRSGLERLQEHFAAARPAQP